MKPQDEIKNGIPFKVPDGYFETLTDRTMSAISEIRKEEEAQEKRPVRKLSLRPYLALAAAVIGFAVIATVMIRLASGPAENNTVNRDTELYTDLVLEDIDTYLIESELNQAGITENPGLDETVSSEAIIDYLVQENVDVDDIYALL
jgi:hypothetical protein